ncbi:MAG TPA: flagellar basal body-associated FliL family protein [Rhodopila sp.]|jgi:flagellar FliL protein|nr:flagellar basal body-associated FliL family protein [Rhodopila sp.]
MAASDTLDGDQEAAMPQVAGARGRLKADRKKLFIIAGAVVAGLAVLGVAAKAIIGMESHKATITGIVALPEMVSNLNAGPRRTSFVRLQAQLVLANSADEQAVRAAEPRIQDLFETYLRDMRPEELRGSAGSYRLREELLARANIAVAPARVTQILFVELLVQ